VEKIQKIVSEYCEAKGLTRTARPTITADDYSPAISGLCRDFVEQYRVMNLVGMAHCIGDFIYKLNEAAVAYGIDLEPILLEIHGAKMNDGVPDIARHIKDQQWS